MINIQMRRSFIRINEINFCRDPIFSPFQDWERSAHDASLSSSPTMSFVDLDTRGSVRLQQQKPRRAAHVPFQRAATAVAAEKTGNVLLDPAKKKKTRSIVLHGKVLKVSVADDLETPSAKARLEKNRRLTRSHETVRQSLQRRSTFSQLTHETQQFQKLVNDLEGILDQSGETPEAAWRAQILIRSAQDADKDLREKLYSYEKTLLMPQKKTNTNKENEFEKEVRLAQSACMKLHRDSNRSHKAFVMALSVYKQRQQAEINRLKSVGWSDAERKDEDFFDRAMRERDEDLHRMNNSMHQVKDIYQELAALVDVQQDDIEQLEDDIRQSKANVEAGVDDIHCFHERQNFCGAMNLGDFIGDDYDCSNLDSSILREDEEEKLDSRGKSRSNRGMRVSEKFNWYMPFETFKEDMKAVHRDIVDVGKDLMAGSEVVKLRSSPRPSS